MVRWLGHAGLALGTSIAALLNATYLLYRLRSLLAAEGGQFSLRSVARGFALHSLLALGMGGVCWMTWKWGVLPLEGTLLEWLGSSGAPLLAVRGAGVAFLVLEGVALLVVLARVLNVSETLDAAHFFWSRVKNKLKRRPIQG